MNINGIPVNTRHNRPSVLDKTALVMYFINDGRYFDPYEISGVSIFAAASNFYPSAVINADGEIDSPELVLMHFANIGDSNTSSSLFDPSNYSAGASGIYRISEGAYAVVLDTQVVSSIFNLSGETLIDNKVSAIGDYIDVWTVRRKIGSDLDTVIGNFTLTEDSFLYITEPLLFKTNTKLENNIVRLGSKVDLKFVTEFTIENTNIDSSIKNLFKQSLVVNPQIEIWKKNTDRNLPSLVAVSSITDTSAYATVTSMNTVICPFDTRSLATHPRMLDGTLGPQTGVYFARMTFEILDQVIKTDDLAFIVR